MLLGALGMLVSMVIAASLLLDFRVEEEGEGNEVVGYVVVFLICFFAFNFAYSWGYVLLAIFPGRLGVENLENWLLTVNYNVALMTLLRELSFIIISGY